MVKVIEKEIEKEFHICDKCGYDLGFHVSFERVQDIYEIILICPKCGQRYRPGWNVELG
ncbi:MAG: hypothetical protein V3R86_07760 [Candidatus Hydrothermarchaeaceae archaeon]